MLVTLIENVGEILGDLPPQGFPRGPDPQAKLKDRHVPVKIIRMSKSKLSEERLKLGVTGMKAAGHQILWDDIQSKRFRLIHEDADSDEERGAEEKEAEDSESASSNDDDDDDDDGVIGEDSEEENDNVDG